MFTLIPPDSPAIAIIMAMLCGYLLGSIPFGLVLTRLTGAGDLRSIGSGSIGATNVLRTGRKGLAALTVIFDLGKGALAIFLADHFWPGLGPLAGLMAFLGHLYPIWLKFMGGKGVATLAGITFALYWPMGLVFAILWLGLLALSRISSVAGMSASVAMPIAALVFNRLDLLPLFVITMVFVLWKHRSNISRLIRGEEPKVGAQKPSGKN